MLEPDDSLHCFHGFFKAISAVFWVFVMMIMGTHVFMHSFICFHSSRWQYSRTYSTHILYMRFSALRICWTNSKRHEPVGASGFYQQQPVVIRRRHAWNRNPSGSSLCEIWSQRIVPATSNFFYKLYKEPQTNEVQLCEDSLKAQTLYNRRTN